MPLKFSSEKHSALFQPVHSEKLRQLWMIHDKSNTFSNHNCKQTGAADARQGISRASLPVQALKYISAIKALGLAPWPTGICARSLLLPTYRGTVPPGQRAKE